MTARAVLLGIGLGSVSAVTVGLALSSTPGASLAKAAIITTLLSTVAVAMWAGASETEHDARRLAERWMSAVGLIVLSAVMASSLWVFDRFLPERWQPLAVLAAMVIPAYGLAFVIPSLLLLADHAAQEDDSAWLRASHVILAIVGGLGVGTLLGTLALTSVWSAGTTLVASAVLLFLGMFLPDSAAGDAQEKILYEATTPFGSLVVSELAYPGERQPERRLYLNGEEESGELVRSGAPVLGYIAAAESWLSGGTPPGSSYLFLGGGAYTLPRRIAERDPRASIVVVELDPEVTRIAHRFFGVNASHHITTVEGDARAFLDKAAASFDRIYLDVYGGGEALPHSLVTLEAVSAMNRLLKPRGAVALNLIGDAVGEERVRLWSVVETMCQVFPMVAVYVHLGRDFPERQNFLIVASQQTENPPARSVGTFELWPREEWPRGGGIVVLRDLHPAPGSEEQPKINLPPSPLQPPAPVAAGNPATGPGAASSARPGSAPERA